MKRDIRLGLRDLLHKLPIFLIAQIQIIVLVIVLVSSSLSLINESNYYSDNKSTFQYYEGVPISYDDTNSESLSREIMRLFNDKDAMTYVYASNLNEAHSIIVFGNPSIMHKDFSQRQPILFYGNEELYQNKQAYDFNGQTYEINLIQKDTPMNDFMGTPTLYIVINDESLLDIINYKEQYIEIISNARIRYSDEKTNSEFIKITENGKVKAVPRERGQQLESAFMFGYFYPYLGITAIALYLCIVIIVKNAVRKQVKEYTIHLLYGATIKNIMIRTMVFPVSTVIFCMSFVLMTLVGTSSYNSKLTIFLASFLIILFIATSYQLLVYYYIKKANLTNNLRGERIG